MARVLSTLTLAAVLLVGSASAFQMTPRSGAAASGAAGGHHTHHSRVPQANPVLPPWPEAFSVPFNVTVLEFGIIGASAYLYYDYTVPAQRLDFALCAANAVLAPCSVIFNATGAYLIQSGKCCQTAPVGTLPPGWTAALAYNSTTTAYGQTVQYFRGGTPIHDYYHNPVTNSPVFLEVEDVYECWTFLDVWAVEPQDPQLFVLPDDCTASC